MWRRRHPGLFTKAANLAMRSRMPTEQHLIIRTLSLRVWLVTAKQRPDRWPRAGIPTSFETLRSGPYQSRRVGSTFSWLWLHALFRRRARAGKDARNDGSHLGQGDQRNSARPG